jgi:hypothetical protein
MELRMMQVEIDHVALFRDLEEPDGMEGVA